ncbi:ferrichrome ABC transporter [Paenibacillaceae bacterium]|nr:ferrichrome ABC transporter [Paenibacillaceae bacterium]
MNRLIGLMAVFIILAGILAGCAGSPGDNDPVGNAPAANDASNPSGEAHRADNDAEPSESEEKPAWPRTITDAVGEVVLEKPPQRVVVLHPLYLDYFFALGKPPIASGNAEIAMAEYETLQSYAGSSADVIDLGSGRDVNLEKVMEVDPDVIVTFKGHIDALYDELSKVAPVIQIDYSDTWEDTMRLCAEITGKEQVAEQYIQETKALIEEAKVKLGELQEKSFALFRVDSKANFGAQGTKNTIYYDVELGFGLQVPAGYPEDNGPISLEALSEMNPDYIILQHNVDVAQAAIKEKESLAVWNALEAVKNDQVLIFDNSLNSGSVLAVRIAAEKFMALAAQ